MKPYIRKIGDLEELNSLVTSLKRQGFTPVVNPDIRKQDYPLYVLIDPEFALYSLCTAEKAKEYEK
jgi:hypothetical protein